MLGSDFRLYIGMDPAYSPAGTHKPKRIGTLVNNAGVSDDVGETSINDLVTDGFLVLQDQIKDVTEAGNPNTINTTTRATGRAGVQSSEITTVSRDLSVQFVYEKHTAFRTPTAGYQILDFLEYCEERSSSFAVIDSDGVLNAVGAKGAAANYTVSLSQPREVEGQVVYDATFALKDFYQRVESNGTLYMAKLDGIPT